MPLLMRGPGSAAGCRCATSSPTSTWRRRSSTPPARTPACTRTASRCSGSPADRTARAAADIAIEGNRYRGVRTPRYIYVHWIGGPDHGATELYDLKRDPYELTNLHGHPAAHKVDAR